MSKRIHILFFSFLVFLTNQLFAFSPMYICSCADSDFFPHLINLINSIHKHNFDQLGQIAVFDLGFTERQVQELNSIEKVSVYDVELTHPDLLKHVRVNNYGKMVRGWYAWKPVAVRQALDMFPYVLHLDAGLMVLKPLDEIFEKILENDYVLVGCDRCIRWMAPKHVIETFDLQSPERTWILDESTEGLAANFIGLTKRMLEPFVLPLYELAHDLSNFVDDSTTPNGFGTARHDQTLFSIQAKLLGLEYPAWKDQARIVSGGERVSCLYKDIVIRAHHLINIKNFDPERMREYIRYK